MTKSTIGEAILDESGTKSENIPPIKDHSLERIGFQKKIVIYVLFCQLLRVAGMRLKKMQFLTIFALENIANIVWLSYQNPKYRVISCGP